MLMRALAVAALMFGAVVHADDSALTARDGWIRTAPPVAQVRAGYVVIENSGDTDVVLTKASSPDFGAIEIHTMYDDAGTMRMRRVPELRVPAKGRVELKPGSLHLMMFRPKRALAEGESVAVELAGDGASLSATLIVRSPAP